MLNYCTVLIVLKDCSTVVTQAAAGPLAGPPKKNGLASSLAAACVKTALQPVDTVKNVQQSSIAK